MKSVSINLEADYNIDEMVEAAVKSEVSVAVRARVEKVVEDAVDAEVRAEVQAIIKKAMRTKVKIFDYDGSVKDERSLEDALRDALKEINKQGTDFKIKTGSGYSRDDKTVAQVIQDDLYQMMNKKLKPFFDKIEADFHSRSKEALREYALKAIDSATNKTLRG